jgi:hypothetical protein
VHQIIPPECQSKTPEQLRTLAKVRGVQIGAAGQELLLNAAAEIEGSEEAYAVLVDENRALREKLLNTEKNLRATISMVPCSPIFE